jgi:hypothetical protein
VELIRTIVSNFNTDFCPVSSVIGSIISQEIVAFYENSKTPALNWIFYDSLKGEAEAVTLQNVIKN